MATVKDLVCGMEIDPKTAAAKMDYKGKTYYFCAISCRDKFKADPEKFDQLQQLFIREIIEQIRLKLTEAGFRDEALKEVTAHIAFSVASTIDDNAGIEAEGVAVKPYLSFVTGDEQLVHGGENSYMHEYVADLITEIFDE